MTRFATVTASFTAVVVAFCLFWSASLIIRNVSADFLPPATSEEVKLHHVLVFSFFGYSHCLEVFGVALTLVDTGRFEVTLIVLEPCRKVVDRLLLITIYPDRIKTVHVPFDFNVLQQVSSNMSQVGVLSKNSDAAELLTQERLATTKRLVMLNDEFLRRNNFSNVIQLHEQHPFDVAICSRASAACFEFADRIGIVAVSAAIQGLASNRDLEHNGLWLSGCGDRVAQQRPPAHGDAATVNVFLPCSLSSRLHALYSYYFCSFTKPSTLNSWLAKACPPARRNIIPVMDHVAAETREDHHARRRRRPVSYPVIDQHVLGTTKPAAYYRPDHAVVGPTWLRLQQADLLGNHDNPMLEALHSWLESARKPVVYVAFGSWTRLNLNETRMMLEAVVSDRWLTIWKTNSTDVQLILRSQKSSESAEKLSHNVYTLAVAGEALKILDWAPQYALLRHAKVKAFVTHGGMSSLMEASGSGMPMVCVPLFAEQPYNCEQVAAMDGGVVLDKLEMTSDTLRSAIERVVFLNDGEDFRESMQTIAQYHASVDTVGRLTEFVAHYAEFKYEFAVMADDYFDLVTYKNWDVYLLVGGIAAVTCVVIHMTCCIVIRGVLLLVLGRGGSIDG